MGKISYYTVNGKIRGQHVQGEAEGKDYLLDASGNLVGVYQGDYLKADAAYDPFGNILDSWNMSFYNFTWAGGHGYRQTGLAYSSVYVRARHYSNLDAGWTTVDPLWPSEMPYGYVDGRMPRGVDPSGMQMTPGGVIIGEKGLPQRRGKTKGGHPTAAGIYDDWDRVNSDMYNCYQFACNVIGGGDGIVYFDEKGFIKAWGPKGMDPGSLSAGSGNPQPELTKLTQDCDYLLSMVKRDLRYLSGDDKWVLDAKNGKCDPGYYMVKAYICPAPCANGQGDFHFVRQNPDGSWSDKHGKSEYGKTYSGNDCTSIENPDAHVRNYYAQEPVKPITCEPAICIKNS